MTVEDTVYRNTWHMCVRATPSILNEKGLKKTVPVIVASFKNWGPFHKQV